MLVLFYNKPLPYKIWSCFSS